MLRVENAIKIFIVLVLFCMQALLLSLDLKPSFDQSKFVWDRGDKLICISDFVRYYVSGEMARSDDREKIYDIPAHYPHVYKITQPYGIAHESAINFPPPAIAVMSFVSLLPFYNAYLVWCSGGLLSAFLSLLLFLIDCRKFKILDAVIFCLLVFNSFTAFLNIRVGQWVDWLIAFYSLFFWSSYKKHDYLAGILLGVLLVKPQYAIPVVLITIVRRQWKTLALAMLTAFGMTVYAASLIGWHNVFIYSKVATELEKTLDVGVAGHAQASLRGLFTNILPVGQAFEVTSTLYFLAVGVFIFMVWKNRKILEERILWVWAIGILIAMTFSPHSLNYDMTLFALPGALTISTISLKQIFLLRSVALRIWHSIILVYPVCSWIICAILPLRMTFLFVVLNLALIATAVFYLKSQYVDSLSPSGSSTVLE